jgi:hypothetical protein
VNWDRKKEIILFSLDANWSIKLLNYSAICRHALTHDRSGRQLTTATENADKKGRQSTVLTAPATCEPRVFRRRCRQTCGWERTVVLRRGGRASQLASAAFVCGHHAWRARCTIKFHGDRLLPQNDFIRPKIYMTLGVAAQCYRCLIQ